MTGRGVLVTGAAGFIGMHVAERLLARGERVVGLDNLNPYYDVGLKHARLARLRQHPGFSFSQIDVADRPALEQVFAMGAFDRVVHLAAQAGVRHSVTHPHTYVESNLVGFVNVLEACRQQHSAHLVYASSSAVYGGNTRLPFRESDPADHPVSLYAATKRANELMAHSYSHLYGLPTTGLRFFAVYGPWGRPDMALFKFTRAILAGDPLPIYNDGRMQRDFTYIDDVADGIVAALDQPAAANPHFDTREPDAATSWAPYRVFNVGHERPVALLDFVDALEAALGTKALRQMLPMQPGDVVDTYADVSRFRQTTGASGPSTSVAEGVRRFVDWYRAYHAVPVPASTTTSATTSV